MAITKELIDRINELAAKNKAEGLTDAEIAERKELREEYLRGIRGQVKNHLSRIRYVEDLTEEEKAAYIKKQS